MPSPNTTPPTTTAAKERAFSREHTRRADECDRLSRQVESERYLDYMVSHPGVSIAINACGDRSPATADATVENYAHVRNGYGYAGACTVDDDSQLRFGFGANMRRRELTQLFPRTFHSVPEQKAGTYRSDVESNLWQGNHTAAKRSDDVLSGVSIDRAVPLIPDIARAVQNPDNLVPSWKPESTRGGRGDDRTGTETC